MASNMDTDVINGQTMTVCLVDPLESARMTEKSDTPAPCSQISKELTDNEDDDVFFIFYQSPAGSISTHPTEDTQSSLIVNGECPIETVAQCRQLNFTPWCEKFCSNEIRRNPLRVSHEMQMYHHASPLEQKEFEVAKCMFEDKLAALLACNDTIILEKDLFCRMSSNRDILEWFSVSSQKYVYTETFVSVLTVDRFDATMVGRKIRFAGPEDEKLIAQQGFIETRILNSHLKRTEKNVRYDATLSDRHLLLWRDKITGEFRLAQKFISTFTVEKPVSGKTIRPASLKDHEFVREQGFIECSKFEQMLASRELSDAKVREAVERLAAYGAKFYRCGHHIFGCPFMPPRGSYDFIARHMRDDCSFKRHGVHLQPVQTDPRLSCVLLHSLELNSRVFSRQAARTDEITLITPTAQLDE